MTDPECVDAPCLSRGVARSLTDRVARKRQRQVIETRPGPPAVPPAVLLDEPAPPAATFDAARFARLEVYSRSVACTANAGAALELWGAACCDTTFPHA